MAGTTGPAIHVYDATCIKTWMPGTRFTFGPAEGRTLVPGMTKNSGHGGRHNKKRQTREIAFSA
jgi:hypothetical protein